MERDRERVEVRRKKQLDTQRTQDKNWDLSEGTVANGRGRGEKSAHESLTKKEELENRLIEFKNTQRKGGRRRERKRQGSKIDASALEVRCSERVFPQSDPAQPLTGCGLQTTCIR
jgi:hypothetical protein